MNILDPGGDQEIVMRGRLEYGLMTWDERRDISYRDRLTSGYDTVVDRRGDTNAGETP